MLAILASLAVAMIVTPALCMLPVSQNAPSRRRARLRRSPRDALAAAAL
ncbi:MAG: hypothetical protein WDN31_10715 [Hyphomicrobium sp.]